MKKSHEAAEPERLYVAGYYLTRLSPTEFLVPKGMVERTAGFNARRRSLDAMLQGVADYVSKAGEQLELETAKFWDEIRNELAPNGEGLLLHHHERRLELQKADPPRGISRPPARETDETDDESP